jgi:hypothetical protein
MACRLLTQSGHAAEVSLCLLGSKLAGFIAFGIDFRET